MTLKQIRKKLAAIDQELRNVHHVQAVFIFGSTARGEAHSRSDVDLLIDFSNEDVSLFDILDLQKCLQKALGRKVDLVVRDALKSWMKADVEKQAVRVA